MIVAIDGGSSSGKTTLAGRIRNAAVVHTDDIAWHHTAFGWDGLLVEHVLEPFRRGEAVRYRPPGWEAKGRPGHVEVPAGAGVLVVEGVGAARRSLRPHVDLSIWVETPDEVARARDEARIAAGEVTREIVTAWMAEEREFLARERQWEHVDLVVAGS